MKNEQKNYAKDVAHCPVCNANAVEPCKDPKNSSCPRDEEEGERK